MHNLSMPHSCGFLMLHGNQLEGLSAVLAQHLRNNPLPALCPEVMMVQSLGMKHWLELQLARDDALGVVAASRIDLPATVLWDIYRKVLGADRVPAQLALDKSILTWRLMRLLPALAQRPEFALVRDYLGEASEPLTTWQLAQQLADVLDGYQHYRSDWLLRWASGDDTPLPPSQRWQAVLWRELLLDVNTHPPVRPSGVPVDTSLASVAQVHQAFLQAVRSHPAGLPMVGVPPRLVVFGVSSLGPQALEALAVLGRVTQVLVCVSNPCQHPWNLTTEHPLLAVWGQQGRDHLMLLERMEGDPAHGQTVQRINAFIDPVLEAKAQQRTPTRLEQLQTSLLDLTPVPAPALEVSAEDDSIVMVQTHGPQREVEVLHDRLLAWLDADPTLQVGDIMVMVPDMATFAPHIHAVLGRFRPNEPRHLPYSVADTTPRTEPMVQAIEWLLHLPEQRVTLDEWMSLFEVPAVRHRFGLSAPDVQALRQWLLDAGVRWGLDAAHRQRWGLPAGSADIDQNTWSFGLRRLLLGYALGPLLPTQEVAASAEAGSEPWDGTWGETAPLPGVSGLDAPVLAGLLGWLDLMDESLVLLSNERTPAEWVSTLQALVERWMEPMDEVQAQWLQRVLAPLEHWLQETESAALDMVLPLTVVRQHWMSALSALGQQRRFLGGGVQFATLMPLRSIPFRVVCLLGLNEGDYPRPSSPRGFDLLADPQHWRPGDRSRREDDRYLFLEALLSARKHLYLSWCGQRATDHQHLQPSLLVAQLRQYLNRVWTPDIQAPLQPLHAFSAAYFQQGSPWQTYAQDWAQVVVTPQASPDQEEPTVIASPPGTLEAKHLRRLLMQPAEVFLIDRLRVRLDPPEEEETEDECFAIDELRRYQWTLALARSPHPQHTLARLQRSGSLSLAGFGELQQEALSERVTRLLEQVQMLGLGPVTAAPVSRIHLPGRDAPEPTLDTPWPLSAQDWHELPTGGRAHMMLRPGSIAEKHKGQMVLRAHTLIDAWLNHLLCHAAAQPCAGWLVGMDAVAYLPPLSVEWAQTHVRQLMTIYQAAWQSPLPVTRKSACAWVQAQRQGQGQEDTMAIARQAFDGTAQKTGEHAQSLSLLRVFEGFEALQDSLPIWADRLYGPMVAHAELWSATGAKETPASEPRP